MIRRPPRSTLFPSPTLFRSRAFRLAEQAGGDKKLRQVDLLPGRNRLRVQAKSRAGLSKPVLIDVDYEPPTPPPVGRRDVVVLRDRKSTRLNSSHANISYAVF